MHTHPHRYAAKLSTSFRLRDFAINDAYPHAVKTARAEARMPLLSTELSRILAVCQASIKISGSDDAGDGEGEAAGKKPKLLFKVCGALTGQKRPGANSLRMASSQANTKMPHKKLISMTRTDDLVATLLLGTTGLTHI